MRWRRRPAGAALEPGAAFPAQLEQAEAERHLELLSAGRAFASPTPPAVAQWFARGRPDSGGYLPLRAAAARMGKTEEETLSLVRDGLLDGYSSGSVVYVQPAVVSVVAVRAGGPEAYVTPATS